MVQKSIKTYDLWIFFATTPIYGEKNPYYGLLKIYGFFNEIYGQEKSIKTRDLWIFSNEKSHKSKKRAHKSAKTNP